jgi:hypothetical protein
MLPTWMPIVTTGIARFAWLQAILIMRFLQLSFCLPSNRFQHRRLSTGNTSRLFYLLPVTAPALHPSLALSKLAEFFI